MCVASGVIPHQTRVHPLVLFPQEQLKQQLPSGGREMQARNKNRRHQPLQLYKQTVYGAHCEETRHEMNFEMYVSFMT